MGNTRALELQAKSHEFDEKYLVINGLTKMLGSFIISALPIHMRREGPDGNLRKGLPSEFGKSAIWIGIRNHRDHGLGVVFTFRDRDHGDPVLSKAQLDLVMVRYLYDNLDIFVEMAEEYCQKRGVLAEFQKHMARFGM